MNAFLRSLLVLVTILLLLPTREAAAGPRRALLGTGTGAPGKYSLVEEYKGAYARPKRKLFGKRKAVNRQFIRARRPSRW